LRLKPSDTFLRSRRGEAPVTALLAGTICSALLAAAAHLTLVARGRAAESRRANQELAESREFLAQLVASLPEAVLTVAADGRIEKVDGAAPQVLARSGASIVGRNVDEFIGLDPGGTKLRQTKKQSGMESLVGTVVDAEVFGQDGQCIYAVIRITAFNTAAGRKYLWTVTDIQWRRQAEQENRRLVEALRRKNDDLQTALDEARDNAQRFEALLESSPEATLLVDEAGRILEFNRRARELLGYTRDEALAGSVEMLVPPEIRPRHAGIRENYMRAPDNRMMARGRDLVAIAKDGTRIPVEINLSPLRFRGRVLVAASLIDLRERLRVADELRTSERRLRAANKELESIVYVASHDMRSPLVNLQGFSRQLAGAVKKLEPLLAQLPPEARAEAEAVMAQEVPEALTFISSSTRKMDGLIKGLLRLSRLGRAPLQMAEVDMNHLVAETVRNTQFVINERGIQVEVADLPRCWGDEIQLGQVFSNIVDNAIKYLDPARSGRVRVTGRV
ncbi:MAG: PAS domain S-box protein, partial [Planctomycetes bacterium]|nr:PAS domain S-box protein [Planctomycetota bacterium]